MMYEVHSNVQRINEKRTKAAKKKGDGGLLLEHRGDEKNKTNLKKLSTEFCLIRMHLSTHVSDYLSR